MKYIIPLISAFLLLRYLSRAKIPDSSTIPSDWLREPPGYIKYNITNFYNSSEKSTLKWHQKAMEWGVYFGIDPALILGCMYSESAGNPNAKRWENNVKQYSYGLMQTLWNTAQMIVGWLKSEGDIPREFILTASNVLDPNLNIMLGSRYLQYQYKRYSFAGGKLRVQYMFSAYNAGSVYQRPDGTYVIINPEYVNKCVNASQKFRLYLNNQYPMYLTMFPKSTWGYSAT